MTNREDKILGSLIAGALGDALGYQIEFNTNVVPRQVTDIGIGMISDDTQMTLFTLTGLLWKDTISDSISYSDAIYLAYLDWLDTQEKISDGIRNSWIKNIKELNSLRAPGNTCLGALFSGKKGTIEQPLNNSKGCGAVMRVAPIGLYIQNPIMAGDIGAKSAVITHGSPSAYYSAYILSSLISILLNSEEIELMDAVRTSIDIFKNHHVENNYTIELLELLNKAIKLSRDDIDEMDAIKALGEGWVADEALAIALYASLKHSDSIEETLICAANHDGDSDSTAAIAGNIIGTYLGYSKIDKDFMKNLELKELILELGHDLYTGKENTDEWSYKYDINNGNVQKLLKR